MLFTANTTFFSVTTKKYIPWNLVFFFSFSVFSCFSPFLCDAYVTRGTVLSLVHFKKLFVQLFSCWDSLWPHGEYTVFLFQLIKTINVIISQYSPSVSRCSQIVRQTRRRMIPLQHDKNQQPFLQQ